LHRQPHRVRLEPLAGSLDEGDRIVTEVGDGDGRDEAAHLLLVATANQLVDVVHRPWAEPYAAAGQMGIRVGHRHRPTLVAPYRARAKRSTAWSSSWVFASAAAGSPDRSASLTQ